MEQIDPRYLQALIAVLNGSDRPITHFEAAGIKIKFESAQEEAEAEKAIPGFVATISPVQPERPDENTPGAMHMRAMRAQGLPTLAAPVPKNSGE